MVPTYFTIVAPLFSSPWSDSIHELCGHLDRSSNIRTTVEPIPRSGANPTEGGIHCPMRITIGGR